MPDITTVICQDLSTDHNLANLTDNICDADRVCDHLPAKNNIGMRRSFEGILPLSLSAAVSAGPAVPAAVFSHAAALAFGQRSASCSLLYTRIGRTVADGSFFRYFGVFAVGSFFGFSADCPIVQGSVRLRRIGSFLSGSAVETVGRMIIVVDKGFCFFHGL